MPTKVRIDTDSLRTAAQYLEGALDQLGDIRMAIVHNGAIIDETPDHATWRQQLVAGIEQVGAALTQDHQILAHGRSWSSRHWRAHRRRRRSRSRPPRVPG